MYEQDIYNPEMTKKDRQIMRATQTYILKQYENFMYGYDIYNPKMTKIDIQIPRATQTYI